MSHKFGIILIIVTLAGLVGISTYFGTKKEEALLAYSTHSWNLRLDDEDKVSPLHSPSIAAAPAPASPFSPSIAKKSIKKEEKGTHGGVYSLPSKAYAPADVPTYPPPTPVPTSSSPSVSLSTVASGAVDSLETQKFYAKAIFSGLILIASLILVFKGGNPDTAKWAFGSLGTILGYWLK